MQSLRHCKHFVLQEKKNYINYRNLDSVSLYHTCVLNFFDMQHKMFTHSQTRCSVTMILPKKTKVTKVELFMNQLLKPKPTWRRKWYQYGYEKVVPCGDQEGMYNNFDNATLYST